MASLDITAPTPRVNAQLMGEFVGKKVKLVGKVESCEGSTLKLKTFEGDAVIVTMQSVVPQTQYVEVEGVVNSPNSLTEEACCAFGDNFDLGNYNELCKLSNSQQYRHMFMP